MAEIKIDKQKEEERIAEAAQRMAEKMVREALPSITADIRKELLGNAQSGQQTVKVELPRPKSDVPVGTLYPIPKERRLKDPAVFEAPRVGKVLGPYVNGEGEMCYPPGNHELITFTPFSYTRKVGGMETKICQLKTYDSDMVKWLKGHPEFNLTFYDRVLDNNLTLNGRIAMIGSQAINALGSMSHSQLINKANELGIPLVENPHTLKQNIAGEIAKRKIAEMENEKLGKNERDLREAALLMGGGG